MQDCWSFTCCLSWTLGSSSKCSQLTFFLWVLLWQMFIWSGHTGIPGLWTQELDVGLWTLGSERWYLDARLWTLYSGRWTLNLDAELSTLDSGHWTLDAGCWLWTLNSGLLTLDIGLWALDTDFDCFRTKSAASFWFSLIKLLNILSVRISKDLMVPLAL